jgi:hypothetical protein
VTSPDLTPPDLRRPTSAGDENRTRLLGLEGAFWPGDNLDQCAKVGGPGRNSPLPTVTDVPRDREKKSHILTVSGEAYRVMVWIAGQAEERTFGDSRFGLSGVSVSRSRHHRLPCPPLPSLLRPTPFKATSRARLLT